jgi:cytochrome c553
MKHSPQKGHPWFSSLLQTVCLAVTPAVISAPSPQDLEFFESKIRPILASECYECHGAEKQKGGLRLDFKGGWEQGGDSGTSILPGNPRESLFLKSVRHEEPDLKMPSKAPKLSDQTIADLEKWIAIGAPDPRDRPAESQNTSDTWPMKLAERRKWWSLQPLRSPSLPETPISNGPAHPVDRFLLAAMAARSIAPVSEAPAGTVLRRLRLVLTGLPPSSSELAQFKAEADASGLGKAVESAADRLLDSPAFGERWARHWMDLVRFSESHGSEGDPALPEAWRYRDYLIRAFNANLPLDQLIREQIAGDLLPSPRWNTAEGFNESAIGTAQLRMVEHGFQPVDTLDEEVKVIDNQIDVISKAFQGITLSCARCHDHKFDAISQRDYYALFGILASTRPVQLTIEPRTKLQKLQPQLASLKEGIRSALCGLWTEETTGMEAQLLALAQGAPPPPALPSEFVSKRSEIWSRAFQSAAQDPGHPLFAWAQLGGTQPADFPSAWERFTASQSHEIARRTEWNRVQFRPAWNLAGSDFSQWLSIGLGLGQSPSPSGDFVIPPASDPVLRALLPRGAFTASLTARANATFASPRFQISSRHISIRAAGVSGAQVRLIVDNYPLGNPTSLFPQAPLEQAASGWVTLNVDYRKGSWAYLEFTTRGDAARAASPKAKTNQQSPPLKPEEIDSWFSVSEVVFHDTPERPHTELPFLQTLLTVVPQPRSAKELAAHYQRLLMESISAWRSGTVSAPQLSLLNGLIEKQLLPTHLQEIPATAAPINEFHTAEAQIPPLTRIPAVVDAEPIDWPLLERGDHLKPGAPVPRGYLEVLGKNAFFEKPRSVSASTRSMSGRLELAEAITSPSNPLTARVMANRIWHHIFGRGLVPSVDNFGRLGEPCSNPELLDHLASTLVQDGWSPKQMIRYLVTSRAFRLSSVPSPEAAEHDPDNTLLSHSPLRRLDAESLRDALLCLSGALDATMYGPSAPTIDSASPPHKNPLYRRSVYLQSKRSVFNELLRAFDAPRPFTTMGRRDLTNVPAQALALLNDPLVGALARRWAESELQRVPEGADTSRIEHLFLQCICRLPSDSEKRAALGFIDLLRTSSPQNPNTAVWTGFAHVLINLKEFLYLP